MDILQMLNNAQAGKPIESMKCQICNGTGREVGGEYPFICSCPAGDREAKKRAEEQKSKTLKL